MTHLSEAYNAMLTTEIPPFFGEKPLLLAVDVNYEFNDLFKKEFHPLLHGYVSELLDINPYTDLLNWLPVYDTLLSAMFSYLLEQNAANISKTNLGNFNDFVIRIESYLNFSDYSKSIESIQFLRHIVADIQYHPLTDGSSNEFTHIYAAMAVYVLFEFIPKLKLQMSPILGDNALNDPVVFKYTGNYNGLLLFV